MTSPIPLKGSLNVSKLKSLYSKARSGFTLASMNVRESLGFGTSKLKLSSRYTPEDAQKVLKGANHLLEKRQTKAGKLAKPIKIIAHGTDLSGITLQNSKLFNDAKLVNVNLQGAKLQGSHFQEARLQKVNLQSAQLTSANLEAAYIEHSDLTKTNLQKLQGKGLILVKSNLNETDFSEATLRGGRFLANRGTHTRFNHSDLSYATTTDGHLTAPQYQAAILKGATLRTKMPNANFKQAQLTKAQLDGHFTQGEFSGTNLKSASLNGNFYRSSFAHADLSQATLTSTDLSYIKAPHATFNKAKLKQVNLEGATLDRTSWREADIVMSTLDRASIQEADFNQALLNQVSVSHTNFRNSQFKEAYAYGIKGHDPKFEGLQAKGSYWVANQFTNPALNGSHFTKSFARDNQGLPTQAGMTLLPDTISYPPLDFKKLTPDEARQEIDRVHHQANQVGLKATVKEGQVDFMTSHHADNAITFNPRKTTFLDDFSLQLTLKHEEGHIRHQDSGYTHVPDREMVRMTLGLPTTHPNHSMEYKADKYAINDLLAQGVPPDILKERVLNLVKRLGNVPDNNPLPTQASQTHPSWQARYEAMLKVIDEFQTTPTH